MNYAKSTIDKRLKLIRKGLREAKKEWAVSDKARSKAMKKHPSYTDDYGRWINDYEHQLDYQSADRNVYRSIEKDIALKDERKYLIGLTRGKMAPFDKHAWSYMK